MNNLKADILAVLNSGITGIPAEVSKDFDDEQATLIVMEHKLDVLFYYGLLSSKIQVKDQVLALLRSRTLMMTSLQVRQTHAAEILYQRFIAENIDFMPLKGVVINKLYPRPEMRYMGDIDVLVRKKQYGKIKKIMKELGYLFITESDHEYIWDKKNILNIELHKSLIPSYNKDYFAYLGDGWELATKMTDNGYVMSDEDFFIYLFVHLSKHYRGGGIGLKHFIDLRIFLDAKPELDFKYIECEIEKLKLLEFYNNSMNLLKVWFDNAKDDEISQLMTEWVFSSGAYGIEKRKDLSAILRKKAGASKYLESKFKIYIRKLFPEFKSMKQKYGFLKKMPFLLPVMWLIRLIEVVLFSRSKIRKEQEKIKALSEERISAHQQALLRVGLDFRFNK